jgi:hypothetical protein
VDAKAVLHPVQGQESKTLERFFDQPFDAVITAGPGAVHRGGGWSCSTESEAYLDRPAPGGDLTSFADALDCDLGLSPVTNAMPVLRHSVHEGGDPVDLLMAWVAVPELSVSASGGHPNG